MRVVYDSLHHLVVGTTGVWEHHEGTVQGPLHGRLGQAEESRLTGPSVTPCGRLSPGGRSPYGVGTCDSGPLDHCPEPGPGRL